MGLLRVARCATTPFSLARCAGDPLRLVRCGERVNILASAMIDYVVPPESHEATNGPARRYWRGLQYAQDPNALTELGTMGSFLSHHQGGCAMTEYAKARYCIGDCPPWDPLARFERDDGQLEYCYMGSGWMQGGVCFFSRAIAEPLPGFIDTVLIEPDQRNRCVSWWTRVCWDREECGGCGDKCEDFETPVFQDCCPAADATRNDCDYLVWPYRRCAPWDDPPHRHTAVATMAFMQVFYPVDGEVTFEKLEDAELKLGVWGVVGDTGSYTGRRYGRTNRCSRWAGDEFDVAGQWDYNSGPHLLDLAYDLSIPGYRIERIYEGLTKTAIDLISGLSNCSDPCFHCFGENWNFEHTWELPEVSVNFQLRAP